MANYRNLVVWQRARILVKQIYLFTHTFPKSEVFGLSSQMQRAAVSVLSNIAEGYGRQSDKELVYFLRIAKGSLFELESQLYVAVDLGYITEEKIAETMDLCDEISRMLAKLSYVVVHR